MRDAHTNRNPRRGKPDPIKRAMRRDLAATLERDYRREARMEVRAETLARFWDRTFA